VADVNRTPQTGKTLACYTALKSWLRIVVRHRKEEKVLDELTDFNWVQARSACSSQNAPVGPINLATQYCGQASSPKPSSARRCSSPRSSLASSRARRLRLSRSTNISSGRLERAASVRITTLNYPTVKVGYSFMVERDSDFAHHGHTISSTTGSHRTVRPDQ
jgi:hypothetical protein